MTLPVFPVKIRFAGVLPEQIVWFAETVPPTDVGSTVIIADAEFALVQTPLVITALK